MSLSSLTQAERSELRYVDVLQLVHITLPSGTILYFSDIDYTYTYGSTSVYYDSYIQTINGLGNVVDIDGVSNPSVNIVLKNKAWSTYDYLILLNDTDSFTRANVSVYELRLTSNTEIFTTDDRVLLWKGNVAQVQSITKETFTLNCCSRLHNKKNAFGLEVIKSSDFSDSKPEDRGKYRNKIYGTVDKVVCRCIKDGAVDYLTTDITSTDTAIPISGVTKIPFAASGTVQIDTEQITYSSITYSGTKPIQLNATLRGANSTTAANHDKGIGVGAVTGEYIYEVADHPIESIDNVFVDDIRQTGVDAPFTTYTGQTTNQLTGYEGTAVVRFTAKAYLGKQVNIDIEDHNHSTDKGSHAHTISGGTAVHKDPTGASSGAVGSYSSVSGANNNLIDGNTGTGITLTNTANASSGDYAGCTATFNATAPGTISQTVINYHVSVQAPYGELQIWWGSTIVASITGSVSKGDYTCTFTNVKDWDGPATFRLTNHQFSRPGDTATIYNVTVDFTYNATGANASAADGVNTNKIGETLITGSTSTSTTVIGNEVTVDVDGYRDDAVGTYTGTALSIIKRPDHVFKHMLIALAGFTSSDIDTSSFSTAGTYYNTNTYNLAFLLHDIGTDSDKILTDLAYQIHSSIWEWGGKFYLNLLPSSTPTSNLTIDNNDVLEYPEYEYTSLDDIVNRLKVFYMRDYRSSGGRGSTLEGVINPDAMAEGFLDLLETVSSAGDLEGSIKLNAVRVTAMAQAILNFWAAYKLDIKLMVKMRLRWKAIQMGPGQYFTYVDPMFGSKIFRVTEFRPNRSSGYIDVSGIESP